ncbi:sulfurtransferase TusA family protein [Dactylosporangium darangshiense]|uniref:sulfurtransferase TusA family protein n=1 Tax=Dactylosporangium darangshiense TaxID=579108 RepID=UPI003642F8C7
MTPAASVDLAGLGFDEGAHVLLRRALVPLRPGARLAVDGRHPQLRVHLPAWCRANGHRVEWSGPTPVIVRGDRDDQRWLGAVRAGSPGPGSVDPRPASGWGLAARGSLVEEGGPEVHFDLEERDLVWAAVAPGSTPTRRTGSGARTPRSTGTPPWTCPTTSRPPWCRS